jgi:hypothetical protein
MCEILLQKKWIAQLEQCVQFSTKLRRVENIESCDIIISLEDHVNELTGYCKKIVLFSVGDNISICGELCENSGVHLIIDHTTLANTASENINNTTITCLNANRLFYLLRSQPQQPNKSVEILPLSSTDNITHVNGRSYMSKTKCLFNTSSCFKRIYDHVVKPLNERKYDIVFLGHLNYTPELTAFKKNIIDAILKMGKMHNLTVLAQESVSQNQYYNVLSNCKIFVSSYGWGEFSTKEYECICKGAHVLKSKIYFETFPKFYENMDDFELDLSNFDEKILTILNHLNDAQAKVDRNRELFQGYNSKNHNELIETALINL